MAGWSIQCQSAPGKLEIMEKPIVYDLYSGLHGWLEAFLLEGYTCVGYDLEDMCAAFGQTRPEGGGDWFGSGDDCSLQRRFSGTKQAGISGPRANGKGDKWFQDGAAAHGSRSNSRKAASAMIAKIPFPLAQYIAQHFHPSRYTA